MSSATMCIFQKVCRKSRIQHTFVLGQSVFWNLCIVSYIHCKNLVKTRASEYLCCCVVTFGRKSVFVQACLSLFKCRKFLLHSVCPRGIFSLTIFSLPKYFFCNFSEFSLLCSSLLLKFRTYIVERWASAQHGEKSKEIKQLLWEKRCLFLFL